MSSPSTFESHLAASTSSSSSSSSILETTTTSTTSMEQIPTLTSLLQATAESLISRSNSKLPTSSTSTSSSTSFNLPPTTTPSSLLSHRETSNYLSTLLKTPLPSLLKLPSELLSNSNSLSTDLSTLSFTRYNSFLQSNQASLSISKSFSTISNSLDSLLISTLELEQTSTKFNQKVRSFERGRESLKKVQDRLTVLEELLETPKLIRQCIQQSQFHEVLKISKKLKNLLSLTQREEGSSSKGSLKLLERLNGEIEIELESLKIKLLNNLRERELKLPVAVRTVSILRKLNLFSSSNSEEGVDGDRDREEEGLRIIFLSSRWKTLSKEFLKIEQQMSLAGINLTTPPSSTRMNHYVRVGVEENDERTRWLKKWFEIWRELVGETISIYNEIFLSSTSTSTSNSSSAVEGGVGLPPLGPISLFISTCLDSLSQILKLSLPSITSTASLSSLLTQLSYCSHSFTKNGLNFSLPLSLPELFSNQVERIVVGEFELAGKEWEFEWRQGWNKSSSSIGSNTTNNNNRRGVIKIKDWLIIPEGIEKFLQTPLPPPPTTFNFSPRQPEEEEEGRKNPLEWSSQPNQILSLIPPLTHLLNSFTNALNSLRLLPPIEIFRTVLKVQGKELERCSRVLEAFVDAWLTSFHSTSTSSPLDLSRSSPNNNNGKEDLISEEENQFLKEREQEKELILKTLGWFGRDLLPWLRNSLVLGVYSELNYVSTTKEGEESEEEGEVLLKEARKRCERLMSRIEGKEWIDPDQQRLQNSVGNNGLAKEKEEEQEGEIPPVLEVSKGPLDETISTSEEKEEGEEVELDFTSEPQTLDETSLEEPIGIIEGGETGAKEEGEGTKEDPNAPYIVDEVAPPLPVPIPEAELEVDKLEVEVEQEPNQTVDQED
ncbi:hypothetical protein JCM5350_001556 [Sporobolomyces pararoseus]